MALGCPDSQVHQTIFHHQDMHPDALQNSYNNWDILHPNNNNHISKMG